MFEVCQALVEPFSKSVFNEDNTPLPIAYQSEAVAEAVSNMLSTIYSVLQKKEPIVWVES